MVLAVSDKASNHNENIRRVADFLARSSLRTAVFKAIYRGKRNPKSVEDLQAATRLSQKQVLTAGLALASQHMVGKERSEGTTWYSKDDYLKLHVRRILALAKNKAAREALPTKQHPGGRGGSVEVKVRLPKRKNLAEQVTVDEIDSFAKVRKIANSQPNTKTSETSFKNGIAKLLGERGVFKDWGGENRDLSSTKLRISGKKRRVVAIAFKGPGMSGSLNPGKMGKNGDQIQRLFQCPAEVFLVQYWNGIADSVLEQLEKFATLKSFLEQKPIWYGIIDGSDSTRIQLAYPEYFAKSKGKSGKKGKSTKPGKSN